MAHRRFESSSGRNLREGEVVGSTNATKEPAPEPAKQLEEEEEEEEEASVEANEGDSAGLRSTTRLALVNLSSQASSGRSPSVAIAHSALDRDCGEAAVSSPQHRPSEHEGWRNRCMATASSCAQRSREVTNVDVFGDEL